MNSLRDLFDLVGVLARKRYLLAERQFAMIGLNHTEARLLTLLTQQGGSSNQEALSQMVNIDRSNTGRALKRLEQEGYVQKVKDESDKRANLVALNKKGQNAAAEIQKIGNAMATDFFGNLTEAQARGIVELLQTALDANPS